MEGVFSCARYAFAPNYYKYCGPDANREIAAYLKQRESDLKLKNYLSEFAVLYPYLKLIARENNISNAFDPRVVEAYWIGNDLLENVGMRAFADHLAYGQRLKDRLPYKKLKWILNKIPKGARIHHSFHVFSVFTRTGHRFIDHTLDTMDQCRIGLGKILQSSKLKTQSLMLQVKSQKLRYHNGKLRLREGVVREVMLPVESKFTNSLKSGDWVTFHWGFVCDKVSPQQINNLKFYTQLNLKQANETI